MQRKMGLMRLPITVLVLTIPVFAGPPAEPITPGNIARLKTAWTYDTGESPHVFPAKGSHFEATPAYSDGKLYLSTPGGLVIALDAETGREIWKRDLRVPHLGFYSEPTTRGVTLAGKVIYAATTDSRLACLDRTTGEPCQDFGASGEIDLRAGLRHKPGYFGEYGVSSPPAPCRL
jgi:glucose dehydrogenase